MSGEDQLNRLAKRSTSLPSALNRLLWVWLDIIIIIIVIIIIIIIIIIPIIIYLFFIIF